MWKAGNFRWYQIGCFFFPFSVIIQLKAAGPQRKWCNMLWPNTNTNTHIHRSPSDERCQFDAIYTLHYSILSWNCGHLRMWFAYECEIDFKIHHFNWLPSALNIHIRKNSVLFFFSLMQSFVFVSYASHTVHWFDFRQFKLHYRSMWNVMSVYMRVLCLCLSLLLTALIAALLIL